MQELLPYVKAYADELLAVAPPLTDEAKRAIQQILGPVVRGLAERAPTARDTTVRPVYSEDVDYASHDGIATLATEGE
jgi:hypothetical protein